ncbi:hypothetical protein [Streptosporangium sp. NBC_01756]|uniref:hypothetical protein n=1 Tax=Streptosporangium sp. NBC_01756 TaxID=2975950 RepID=UPI002DD9506E|nr:hypothetical protein [Streptosporangium sp. NBC_01756]WSC89178.1 hypothetical protein OIE48_13610 [Streptosporangium sp. NBC_01756]
MPMFKSVFAGLAISTALAGGIVSLGAATTMTTANAAVAQTTIVGFQTCGGGCGGGWGGCRREHRCENHRFRLRIHTNNDNRNIVRGDNDQAQAERQFQWNRHDED